MEAMASLTFRETRGGPRHFLDGEPVRAGDIIEIQMPDGSWCRGRYGRAGKLGALAALYVMFDQEHGAWMEIREEDELRWPRAGEEGERGTSHVP